MVPTLWRRRWDQPAALQQLRHGIAMCRQLGDGGAAKLESCPEAPWALGSERIDARDYDDDVVFPDLAVNPDDGVLSVVNATRTSRVFYVTVYDHPVLDARGAPFPPGAAVDETLSLIHI